MNGHPLFDPATHYRIKLSGRVDVEWLRSFESSAQVSLEAAAKLEGITVISLHTDQSGIVGLVRKLHGLGITILQLEIVLDGI